LVPSARADSVPIGGCSPTSYVPVELIVGHSVRGGEIQLAALAQSER